MPRSPSRSTSVWITLADGLTLALLALAAVIAIWDPGWRLTAFGVRLSLRSAWRVLAWAAVLTALRHAIVRSPSLPRRVVDAAGLLERAIGRSAARLREVVRHAMPILAAGGVRSLRRLAQTARAEAASLVLAWQAYWTTARQCRVTLTIVAVLVILRSLVLVGWEQAHFDSDQAVVGLMAKHLAEGRAFPLFYYGQSYMLAVQAWLAAPLFLLAGPSVTALKLPLLAINVLVAWLLIVLFRRELGLGGPWALAASVFFVLAPPGAATRLLEANGGSVEPLLYVLFLWMTRRRPALFGIILGIGFLHREFTLYALGALVFLEVLAGRAFSRENLRRLLRATLFFVATLAAVQTARVVASPLGPGTRGSLSSVARTNVGELSHRFCWAPGRLASRLEDLRNRHLGVLFGTAAHPLWKLHVTSATTWQGHDGLGTLMLAGLVVVIVRTAIGIRRRRIRLDSIALPLYLVTTGVASVTVYWALSCENLTVETLRYGLLALGVPIGLAAAFFRVEPSRAWKVVIAGILAVWTSVSLLSHARLLTEYLTRPPVSEARQSVDMLTAQGVRFAHSKHSIAFWFTFLSGERLILSSDDFPRITEHQVRVDALGAKADRVKESPCDPGVHLAGRFYRCPQ